MRELYYKLSLFKRVKLMTGRWGRGGSRMRAADAISVSGRVGVDGLVFSLQIIGLPFGR